MEEANYDENSMMYLAISNLFLVFLGVGPSHSRNSPIKRRNAFFLVPQWE